MSYPELRVGTPNVTDSRSVGGPHPSVALIRRIRRWPSSVGGPNPSDPSVALALCASERRRARQVCTARRAPRWPQAAPGVRPLMAATPRV
eukprot:1191322-Prorocentrum_minimum.AAC.3